MLKIKAYKQDYLEKKHDTQLKNTKIVPQTEGDNQELHHHYHTTWNALEGWCELIAKQQLLQVEDIRRMNFKYHPFKKQNQRQLFEYGPYKRLKHQQGPYYTVADLIEMIKAKALNVLHRDTGELEHFTVGMYKRINRALDWFEEYDRKYNGGDRHGTPGKYSKVIKSLKVKIDWLGSIK